MYANKFTIDKCPLCDSADIEHFIDCNDYYATGEKFAVFKCRRCGFRFTQDVPVEAEIGPYYESPDYISHTDTHKGCMNRVYHWVRQYMIGKKVELINRFSDGNNGRLLDYGAGTGYFIQAMKKQGWKVEAIEKSSKARDFAHEHFGLEMESEIALDYFKPAYFSVVTLWHSMEHVEKLGYLWERLHDILEDNGTLIIAVPNCSSYDAEYYKELWAAYDVPRHLWHFTPETMKRMGEKHGFSLVEEEPMPFDAFYVSMLSEKYKGSSSYFLKGMWIGLHAFFACRNNKRKSSSLIYVFKKNVYEKEK